MAKQGTELLISLNSYIISYSEYVWNWSNDSVTIRI